MKIKQLLIAGLILTGSLVAEEAPEVNATENKRKDFPTTYSSHFKENQDDVNFEGIKDNTDKEMIELAQQLGFMDHQNVDLNKTIEMYKELIKNRLVGWFTDKEINEKLEKFAFLDEIEIKNNQTTFDQLRQKVEANKVIVAKNKETIQELEDLFVQIIHDGQCPLIKHYINNFIAQHQTASIIGGVVAGVSVISGIGYAVYKWYKKKSYTNKQEKKQVHNDFDFLVYELEEELSFTA